MRGALLLLVGALIMHWLCYLPSRGAGLSETAQAAHSYLLALTPGAIGLSVAVIAATLLAALIWRPRPTADVVSLERRAARYAITLLGIFLAQEAAELAFADGTASGADAVVGEGGWLAPPLAFALGLVAALLGRKLDRFEGRIAAIPVALPRSGWQPPAAPGTEPRVVRLATLNLAFGLARRPPPNAAF